MQPDDRCVFQKGEEMRKQFVKKSISFLLVMLLCASFLPMCVFAAETGQATEQSDIQMMTQEKVAESDVVLSSSEEAIQEETKEESNSTPVLTEDVSEMEKTTEQLPTEEKIEVGKNVDSLQSRPAAIEDEAGKMPEKNEGSDMKSANPEISEKPEAKSTQQSLNSENNLVPEEPSLLNENEWYGNWNLWNHGFRINIEKNKTFDLSSYLWNWYHQDDVIWTSSNEDVATVDDKTGVVTLHRTGDVFIEATYRHFIFTYTDTFYLYVFSGNDNPGSGSDEPGTDPEMPVVEPTEPVVDEPGTDGQNEDESDTTTVPIGGGSGSDSGGPGADGHETAVGDQTSAGQTDAVKEGNTTVNQSESDSGKSETVQTVVQGTKNDTKSTDVAASTKTSTQVQTVTSTAASSDESTTSVERSQSYRPVATQNDAQVTPEGETAAVPSDVINEPSVPTAAYVNPAGSGDGAMPIADNMAAHAGAVAGMFAAVAAFGAAGMVKAYKLKKYESDV